jgi:HEAT repeat protein
MLRTKAAPAEAALKKHLDDPSGAVQVAAAEALAALGKPEAALPVLERWLQKSEAPFVTLQATNVLDRMGERARPSLPAMKTAFAALPKEPAANSAPAYQHRMLEHIIDVLEGRELPLVYPDSSHAK